VKPTVISFLAAAAMIGCSTPYVPRPLGSDHPASTSAAETPPPPPSTVFTAADDEALPEEEAKQGHGGHGNHRGHEMHGGQR
jgi:hypothetical protein